MKFILDTNAVSALMRGEPRMVERLKLENREEIGIPQPVLAEIAYGIERLPPSKRRDDFSRRFELVKAELSRVPWSDEVSEAFGRIKAQLEKEGRRVEDFDAAIAAHALAGGAVLVTANLDHMTRVSALMVEDWSAES